MSVSVFLWLTVATMCWVSLSGYSEDSQWLGESYSFKT